MLDDEERARAAAFVAELKLFVELEMFLVDEEEGGGGGGGGGGGKSPKPLLIDLHASLLLGRLTLAHLDDADLCV